MHTQGWIPDQANRQWGQLRCRLRLFCLVSGLVLMGSGCKLGSLTGNDKKYDLLEAELRTRERELTEARAELNQTRLLNQTYQRQPQQPHPGVGPGGWVDPTYSQHGGAPTLPLREITLGTGTGGVDDDRQPGDESLQVVIIPKDDDGTAIKLPGKALVMAFEINRQGLKTQIGQWEVSPEQLRKTWRSGLLSSGYFVPLQWDKAPGTDRLRIAVRFTTLDGKDYEADKDVTVRPLPGIPPHGAPTTTPTLPPQGLPVPPGAEELPPPTRSPAARFKLAKPG